jgi:hypothetical protein
MQLGDKFKTPIIPRKKEDGSIGGGFRASIFGPYLLWGLHESSISIIWAIAMRIHLPYNRSINVKRNTIVLIENVEPTKQARPRHMPL